MPSSSLTHPLRFLSHLQLPLLFPRAFNQSSRSFLWALWSATSKFTCSHSTGAGIRPVRHVPDMWIKCPLELAHLSCLRAIVKSQRQNRKFTAVVDLRIIFFIVMQPIKPLLHYVLKTCNFQGHSRL